MGHSLAKTNVRTGSADGVCGGRLLVSVLVLGGIVAWRWGAAADVYRYRLRRWRRLSWQMRQIR
jgi:hypothetical protein